MTCFVDQPWHHQIEKQSKKLSYISQSTSQTFIHQYRNQGTGFKIYIAPDPFDIFVQLTNNKYHF